LLKLILDSDISRCRKTKSYIPNLEFWIFV
jgi:hypothetical protein